jgi:hypothetical protein
MDNYILEWIRQNNLWFVVGWIHTRVEFVAEIWRKNNDMTSTGWHGTASTPEDALVKVYMKAKDELNEKA